MISNSLKKKIIKSSVISFDIYDTLLFRKVTPKEVFSVVQDIYNKLYDNNVKNFKEMRINAEVSARRNTKTEEITIDDIYSNFNGSFKSATLKIIKNIEIEVEKSIIFPNPELKEVYEFCKDNNKRIIIVSDMYLPSETVKEILSYNDICYEKLFLSSECKYTKRTGSIFDFIIRTLKVKPSNILHIGDNIKSDVIRPKIRGINVHKIKHRAVKENDYKVLLLKSYRLETNNVLENLGYNYLGPLVLEFCKYIYSFCKETSTIFLAREGKFIKECYDIVYPKEETSYFYVSRKSITRAAMYEKNNRIKIFNLQSVNQDETVEEFLSRVSAISEENIRYLLKNGIYMDEKLENCYKKILDLAPNLNINSYDYKIFKKYIRQFDISNNTKIIDIGWNGTMQDILSLITNKKIEGIYLGLRKQRANKYKKGFLFDENEFNYEILSRGMVDFLEVLFAANHGSVISYYEDTNTISPNLNINDIPSNVYDKVRQIQLYAIRFIKDNMKDYIFMNLSFKEVVRNAFFEIGICPSSSFLNIFSDFYTFDEKEKYLLPQKNIMYYFFHPKELKKEYISSGWKFGFLKKIFKIKFLYKKIYFMSLKMKKVTK